MTAPALTQGALASLTAIVRDERSALLRLARDTRVSTMLLPFFATIAVGIAVLGGDRWLALPRITPFVVWVVAIGTAVWVWRRRGMDGGRLTTPDAVAEAIESEQRLRRGEIRVAQEVAESGPLGAHAAAMITTRALAGTSTPRAPRTFAAMRDVRQRALWWAAGALVATLGAGAIWSDGAVALANPIGAWRGTLLPPLVLDAPTVVLRGSSPDDSCDWRRSRDARRWKCGRATARWSCRRFRCAARRRSTRCRSSTVMCS